MPLRKHSGRRDRLLLENRYNRQLTSLVTRQRGLRPISGLAPIRGAALVYFVKAEQIRWLVPRNLVTRKIGTERIG